MYEVKCRKTEVRDQLESDEQYHCRSAQGGGDMEACHVCEVHCGREINIDIDIDIDIDSETRSYTSAGDDMLNISPAAAAAAVIFFCLPATFSGQLASQQPIQPSLQLSY